jgi:hypothetical protein
VNVVFLMLTTAVGAGAEPAPVQPANPPAVVAPAPAATSCGCGGEIVDYHAKSSFFGRFRHSKKSDCCDSCAPAPAPCCQPATAPSCMHSACDSCGDSCCGHGKSSFFDRFRGRFSKKSHDCECGCDSCGGNGAVITTPAPAPAPQTERLKKMPKGENEGKKIETAPKPLIKMETEGKNPFELDRRYVQRAGRAADSSKLTGQLFYAHTDGGVWVLRYAPLDTEDSYGGGVVLARDRSMNGYREGDLVTIEGQVLEPKWSIHLGGPLYQIRTISLVDRPQP